MKHMEKLLKRQELARAASDFILNCRDEDFAFLTVSWLARHLNTSPANLSRAFVKENPMTLQAFLIGGRLYRSAEYIKKNPHLTIDEVAEVFGYDSPSHFCKLFKSAFGRGPGEWLQ